MGTIPEILIQARRLQRVGELKRAELLYQEILQADPQQSDALCLLGMVCQRQNRIKEALDYYRRALPLRPNDANLAHHLGLACQALGLQEEAGIHFRHAIHLRPEFADAHFGLGNVHLFLRQLDEAIAQFRQAVKLQPETASAYLNLANALQAQGRLQEAAECLRDYLSRHPEYAEGQYNLGNVLVTLGRFDEAAGCYQAAIRFRPGFAQARNNLGSVFQAQGKLNEAIEQFEEALRLQPNHAGTYVNLGGALRERSQVDAAIEAYQKALQLQPHHAGALNNLAEACLELGDASRAQTYFREALRHDPAYVQPLLNLAANGFYSAAEPGIEQFEARLADQQLSPDVASQLHFVAGYLLDRSGETDAAFSHFSRGNALRRAMLQESGTAFDAAAHSQQVDRLIAFFSHEFFERTRGLGLATELPVFIVGMPRSGSTLVEQILSRHSQVHGAGELRDVCRLVVDLPEKLGTADAYPECLTALNGEKTLELAEGHLRQLVRWSGSAVRVTDKMLDNFLHLGLLAVLFPRARVIHCRRDALDVCLSCFFQYFNGLKFTLDLGDLGRYYRDYERLMEHWRSVLPLRMVEISYENVVADLESVTRRLVDFCGLEWEDRCVRFHENERSVRTMSKVQVRQPVYSSSMGRWRRYAAHLGPLFELIGRSAECGDGREVN